MKNRPKALSGPHRLSFLAIISSLLFTAIAVLGGMFIFNNFTTDRHDLTQVMNEIARVNQALNMKPLSETCTQAEATCLVTYAIGLSDVQTSLQKMGYIASIKAGKPNNLYRSETRMYATLSPTNDDRVISATFTFETTEPQ